MGLKESLNKLLEAGKEVGKEAMEEWSHFADDVKDKTKEATEEVSEEAGDIFDKIKNAASDFVEKAKHYGEEMMESNEKDTSDVNTEKNTSEGSENEMSDRLKENLNNAVSKLKGTLDEVLSAVEAYTNPDTVEEEVSGKTNSDQKQAFAASNSKEAEDIMDDFSTKENKADAKNENRSTSLDENSVSANAKEMFDALGVLVEESIEKVKTATKEAYDATADVRKEAKSTMDETLESSKKTTKAMYKEVMVGTEDARNEIQTVVNDTLKSIKKMIDSVTEDIQTKPKK